MILLLLLAACGRRGELPRDMLLAAGGVFSFETVRGQPLWLEFWTPWDPASRRRILEMEELAARYHPRGVVAVAVALACMPSEVLDLLGENELPMILGVDDRVARALEVEVVPTTVLLDSRRREVWRRYGYVEPQVLRRHLEELLQDEAGEGGHFRR